MITMDRLAKIQDNMVEQTAELYEKWINPSDRFWDTPSGERWGLTNMLQANAATGFQSESELAEARRICRNLAFTNEYTINAIENRISYVIGTGHTYTVSAKESVEVSDDAVQLAQEIIDSFIQRNHWGERQEEMSRRRDRDGEVFLRYFETPAGLTVRFVEPGAVTQPKEKVSDSSWSWGIQTDPDDVEQRLAYWIDGQPVEASEIQHRRPGVDATVKRGIPLFWPVWMVLMEVENLQRNMNRVAGIQTAIAMIRKHQAAEQATVETMRDKIAKFQIKDEDTDDVRRSYEEYPPGTILDAPASTEYQFPASGIDASRFVAIKQEAIRQVASRLVMPEFMLSSNAANSNYASTLVAEGPVVKYFERLQNTQRTQDLEVMWRSLRSAGMESPEEIYHVEVGMPVVQTRDKKVEAETNRLYVDMKVKSKQTVSGELNLDYGQEQQNIEEDKEATLNPFPPLPIEPLVPAPGTPGGSDATGEQ